MRVGTSVKDLEKYIGNRAFNIGPIKNIGAELKSIVEEYLDTIDLPNDLRYYIFVNANYENHKLTIEFSNPFNSILDKRAFGNSYPYLTIKYTTIKYPWYSRFYGKETLGAFWLLDYGVNTDIRDALVDHLVEEQKIKETKQRRNEEAYQAYKSLRQSFPNWDETTLEFVIDKMDNSLYSFGLRYKDECAKENQSNDEKLVDKQD